MTKIERGEPERVEIFCHALSDEVREIVAFVKSRRGQLTGTLDDRQYEVPVTDIFYIESVDNKTFIYSSKDCYETTRKLYEFEELLKGRSFLRISKSVVLNIMKVDSIKPALNGRFSCILRNGEEVIISRKYVNPFKEFISKKV